MKTLASNSAGEETLTNEAGGEGGKREEGDGEMSSDSAECGLDVAIEGLLWPHSCQSPLPDHAAPSLSQMLPAG